MQGIKYTEMMSLETSSFNMNQLRALLNSRIRIKLHFQNKCLTFIHHHYNHPHHLIQLFLLENILRSAFQVMAMFYRIFFQLY